MKALIQRVDRASVTVDGVIVGVIDKGLVVLVGIADSDNYNDIEYIAEKTINLRIFPDINGKFNLSLKDLNYEVLIVSQFTLLADTKKGRRPNFMSAALPDRAEDLFNQLVKLIKNKGIFTQTGEFQKHMILELVNNGPVTIMIDSKEKHF